MGRVVAEKRRATGENHATRQAVLMCDVRRRMPRRSTGAQLSGPCGCGHGPTVRVNRVTILVTSQGRMSQFPCSRGRQRPSTMNTWTKPKATAKPSVTRHAPGAAPAVALAAALAATSPLQLRSTDYNIRDTVGQYSIWLVRWPTRRIWLVRWPTRRSTDISVNTGVSCVA